MKLTHKDILNMSEGYEIDTLIAEKLFNWKLQKREVNFANSDYWVNKKGAMMYYKDGFSPSKGIQSAWLVWEKLVKMERFPTLHQGYDENGDDIYVWVELVNPADISVKADTAPLAICRAALMAVTEEK